MPQGSENGAAQPAGPAWSDDGCSPGAVLVVCGTHGNERNAPWLLDCWGEESGEVAPAVVPLQTHGLRLWCRPGNPAAIRANQRYQERDLNRSFALNLLEDPECQSLEVRRARELVNRHGPGGARPCLVAIDLHSTTAAMGNCLVSYSRRPQDLALAAAVQGQLGLPVYLHEGDPAQVGYLAELWPAGVVIEVGPVPQGVVQAGIVSATRLGLEACLDALAQARAGGLRLPRELVVHRHLGSLDLPRDAEGRPTAAIHPRRQNRDWQPIRAGDPLFLSRSGETLAYRPEQLQHLPTPPPLAGPVWPVFINEAAYGEKGIALSLTSREVWPVQREWGAALSDLARRLQGALAGQAPGG